MNYTTMDGRNKLTLKEKLNGLQLFKITFSDGQVVIAQAKNYFALHQKYDLGSEANTLTIVEQIS